MKTLSCVAARRTDLLYDCGINLTTGQREDFTSAA